MASKVQVVLRNPLRKQDTLAYDILVQDHELGADWLSAIKNLLLSGKMIEKNFCFLGFPSTPRDIAFLCTQLQAAVSQINGFFTDYTISESFRPDTVVGHDWTDNGVNHTAMNALHNHFERLQGTVGELSPYYRRADYATKWAIRQLNNLCHELESVILSQRKWSTNPDWVRPSQITTWLTADRLQLKPQHRELFRSNGYDRVFGGVYMHWTQIGKTLFEVFRDEAAPELTTTVCEAITHLQYYSGEFDVEWGRTVQAGADAPWHDQEQARFRSWLIHNGLDPEDTGLSLGYLPLGQVDTMSAFGTQDPISVWQIMANYLDIYTITVDGVTQCYDYTWADADYQQRQIDMMRPGYDYTSRLP